MTAQTLRRGLPPVPSYMARLPLDKRGYPVPFFAAYVNGEPDFRIMDPKKYQACVQRTLCWVCGQPLFAFKAFVSGPMCGINRVSAEPPSHLECALFSAQACPFLILPKAKRNESGIPEDAGFAGGIGLKRNPGCALVWVTKSYALERVPNGVIVRMGPPEKVYFFCEGREAKREEIMASVESGLVTFRGYAAQDGPGGMAVLDKMVADFMALLPTD